MVVAVAWVVVPPRGVAVPDQHARGVVLDLLDLPRVVEVGRVVRVLQALVEAVEVPPLGQVVVRLGRATVSKDVRIIDDPLRVRRLRSQTFDPGRKVQSGAHRRGRADHVAAGSATARDFAWSRPGMPIAASRRRLGPGRITCIIVEPSAITPGLMSDIRQGFYVTDLIGSGVNGVTAITAAARPASRSRTAGSPIVSEVTIAGHLLPIQIARRGRRSRVPLRDRPATLRIEGLTLGGTDTADRCVAHDAALLTDTVRQAGALALCWFVRIEELDQGYLLAVSEADIAVNDLVEEIALGDADSGWLSEEDVDDRILVSARSWSGSSIRSTVPAPISPARDWCVSVALVAAGRRSGVGIRSAPDQSLFRDRGQGTTLDARPVRRHQGPVRFPRMAARAAGAAVEPRWMESRCVRESDRCALRLCLVADGRLDAAFAGGQSRDWDLAAADLIVQEANGRMTALSGDAIEYNRREVAHRGVGSSGTRSSCAHCRAFSRSPVALNRPIRATNRPAHLATHGTNLACHHDLPGTSSGKIPSCQIVPSRNCSTSSSAAN